MKDTAIFGHKSCQLFKNPSIPPIWSLGRFLLNLRGNTNISEKQITNTLILLQNVVRTYVSNSLHRVEEVLVGRGINFREYFNIDNEIVSTDCIFDLNNKV